MISLCEALESNVSCRRCFSTGFRRGFCCGVVGYISNTSLERVWVEPAYKGLDDVLSRRDVPVTRFCAFGPGDAL